ncbi:hypothetical protein AABB24_006391, partial [Solanum stoloniferum]
PNIICHFHREKAQSPEKFAVATTPLAGETTNTLSLVCLRLRRTLSPFFLPHPSPTSKNPKIMSRRTSSLPLTSLVPSLHCLSFSVPSTTPVNHHGPPMLSILSGVPEGQKISRCLRCTIILLAASGVQDHLKKMKERKKEG